MVNITRPVSTSSRRMPINRSIRGLRQLAAEGGLEDFKPRHSLERRGGMEDSNRPHTASAAEVRTVSELREGGRVDRTPAEAEIRAHELSTLLNAK
jgi:hypothetical protein